VSGPGAVVLAPYHRQASDALGAGDLDALVDLFAPGFVDRTSGEVGVELLRARVDALIAAFTGIRFVITHSVADGSLLAGRGHITGVHTGPFGAVPATGAVIDVETVDVVRLGEDGRVAERWGGLDRFALLTQLGVLPGPP
jgi:predicted ester cyclase